MAYHLGSFTGKLQVCTPQVATGLFSAKHWGKGSSKGNLDTPWKVVVAQGRCRYVCHSWEQRSLARTGVSTASAWTCGIHNLLNRRVLSGDSAVGLCGSCFLAFSWVPFTACGPGTHTQWTSRLLLGAQLSQPDAGLHQPQQGAEPWTRLTLALLQADGPSLAGPREMTPQKQSFLPIKRSHPPVRVSENPFSQEITRHPPPLATTLLPSSNHSTNRPIRSLAKHTLLPPQIHHEQPAHGIPDYYQMLPTTLKPPRLLPKHTSPTPSTSVSLRDWLCTSHSPA